MPQASGHVMLQRKLKKLKKCKRGRTTRTPATAGTATRSTLSAYRHSNRLVLTFQNVNPQRFSKTVFRHTSVGCRQRSVTTTVLPPINDQYTKLLTTIPHVRHISYNLLAGYTVLPHYMHQSALDWLLNSTRADTRGTTVRYG